MIQLILIFIIGAMVGFLVASWVWFMRKWGQPPFIRNGKES